MRGAEKGRPGKGARARGGSGGAGVEEEREAAHLRNKEMGRGERR